MMQNPWFKAFIWFVSAGFFFLAATSLISLFSPNPSEVAVMQYMSGMMGAMQNSLMGLSMTLENQSELLQIISVSSEITLPLLMIGFFAGIWLRVRRSYREK